MKDLFAYFSFKALGPGRADHGREQWALRPSNLTLPTRSEGELASLFCEIICQPDVLFVVVAVRKDFIGPVGFFYGEHFGSELTMEISEFTPGNH